MARLTALSWKSDGHICIEQRAISSRHGTIASIKYHVVRAGSVIGINEPVIVGVILDQAGDMIRS